LEEFEGKNAVTLICDLKENTKIKVKESRFHIPISLNDKFHKIYNITKVERTVFIGGLSKIDFGVLQDNLSFPTNNNTLWMHIQKSSHF